MPNYSKYPQSKEVYRHWVDTIIDEAQDKLNEWELNFVTDIDKRLETFSGALSENQAKKLEDIYSKHTS